MSTTQSANSGPLTTWESRPIVVTLWGPNEKQVYPIEQPFVRIGRDPRSEVVLPDGAAKRLYLHGSAAGIYCLGLERRAQGDPSFSGWVQPRRRMAAGSYQVSARFADAPTLNEDAAPPQPAVTPGPLPQLELSMVGGRRQPVRLRLRRPLTIVGREPPSKLCLADASISRAHCILFWDDARLWVIDLFSANGVLVNEHRVECGIVDPGSSLVLGKVRLTYVPHEDSEWSPPREESRETGSTVVLPAPPALSASDTQTIPAINLANERAAPGSGPTDSSPAQGAETDEFMQRDSDHQTSLAPAWDRQALLNEIGELKSQLEAAQTQRECDEQRSNFDASGDATGRDHREAIVNELRREAQLLQAEQSVEQKRLLMADLEAVRVELANSNHERELATARQQQAEHMSAEMSARLLELEQALAAREADLAAARQRESQYQIQIDELTAQRQGEQCVVQDQVSEPQSDLAQSIDQPVDMPGSGLADAPVTPEHAWHSDVEPPHKEEFEIDLEPSPVSMLFDELAPGARSGEPDKNDDGPTTTVDFSRRGALVPVPDMNAGQPVWLPAEVISDVERLAGLAECTYANDDIAVGGDRVIDAASPARTLILQDSFAATTRSANGEEDDLFDQLISTQARHAITHRRRRLLTMLAISGASVVLLAAVLYWTWQPLVKMLGL